MGGRQHHHQDHKTIANRPQTVSSLSSIDTAGYEQNDTGLDSNTMQQSIVPPLGPFMDPSGSSSTVVTTATSATSADTNFGLTSNTTFFGSSASSAIQEPDPAATSAINLSASSSIPISTSTGVLVAATPNTNTVPEFLYQLTKMLTDNNRDIIEWSNGKIEVHSPHKLETHVLNRYFRHSKFASFQRQLNYFGFRKLAGKGKMAPCSYVNDATTDELGSLLLIKRKQGNEPKGKAGGKKRDRNGKEGKCRNSSSVKTTSDAVNPVLAGILYRSSSDNAHGSMNSSNGRTLQQSQKAIARVAVGKGVRHGYVPHQTKSHSKSVESSSRGLGNQLVAPSPVQASLNALTQNFNQSINEIVDNIDGTESKPAATSSHQDMNQSSLTSSALSTDTSGRVTYVPGSLHRDDSLVDLAMIPILDDGTRSESNVAASSGFSFVDFPFDSNFFSNEDPDI